MRALDGLYQQCLLRSTERTETHALIAQELSDHRLRWQGGTVDTRLYKFQAQRLALYSLQYGDAVSIFPEPYRHFSLVHFSASGAIEVQSDGYRQTVPPLRAAITTPQQDIHLDWARSCRQLILRVPHAMLEEAAMALGQPALFQHFLHTPNLLLDTTHSLHWFNQLQAFMSLQAHTLQHGLSRAWHQHMEQGMAMFLLLQFTAGRPSASGHPEAVAGRETAMPSAPHIRRRLDRLRDYADAQLTNPVTLADMARACSLSVRQLNAVCQQHYGTSPIAWLRQLRLQAAYQSLRSDPLADVSTVAMRYGFTHLGRFAALYRQTFGELPSQTRKSAISG